MKQRSIVKMFLLEFVTLGIYRLYWFVKTRRELMQRTGVKIAHPLILVIPLILFMGAIIFLIRQTTSGYSSVGKYDECMSSQGFPSTSASQSYTYQDVTAKNTAIKYCDQQVDISTKASLLPSLLLTAMILIYLPISAWWLWGYCEAVEKVTGDKISRVLGMILFLVVPDGIDILIVQDYFNKVPPAQGVKVS